MGFLGAYLALSCHFHPFFPFSTRFWLKIVEPPLPHHCQNLSMVDDDDEKESQIHCEKMKIYNQNIFIVWHRHRLMVFLIRVEFHWRNNNLDASFHNYSNEMNIKKVLQRRRPRRTEHAFLSVFLPENLDKLQFRPYSTTNCWTLCSVGNTYTHRHTMICTGTQFMRRVEIVSGMEDKIKAQIFSLPFVLNVFRKFIFNSPSFPLCLVSSFFFRIPSVPCVFSTSALE